MEFRQQLAMWTASLAEAHTQDLRWHDYDRVLEMALGRASKVVMPDFNKQRDMYLSCMRETNCQDVDWYGYDLFLENLAQEASFDSQHQRDRANRWMIAILVPCKRCGVAAGERCVDLSYDGRKRGRLNYWPHAGRTDDGRKIWWQHGPDWEEEQEEPEEEEQEEPTIEVGSVDFSAFIDNIEAERERKKREWVDRNLSRTTTTRRTSSSK